MVCIKCNQPIPASRRSVKYCSQRCSKLYLKAQWKKRTSEHQRVYQRLYRRAKQDGNRPPKFPAKYRLDACLKCGTTEDLQGAHVKPLWAGGRHNHIITLCRKHHYQFDNLLRDFWREGSAIASADDRQMRLAKLGNDHA
jgi:hypothetical protein